MCMRCVSTALLPTVWLCAAQCIVVRVGQSYFSLVPFLGLTRAIHVKLITAYSHDLLQGYLCTWSEMVCLYGSS